MLKLILGREHTNKADICISAAKNVVYDKKKCIVLVPEQFSYECQRILLDKLGATVSNKIDIHSFTSLCEAVSALYGGISGRNVDDGTRFILTRQAAVNVKDNLKLYSQYAESHDFIDKIMTVLSEMKQADVSADKLYTDAASADSKVFSDKLHDVALIMRSYDTLLKNKFTDPLDLLNKTADKLSGKDFFVGKTVIIDKFKGFTEAQYKLLDRIIAGAENVYISLCCDSPVINSEVDVFKNVSKTANRLIGIAEAHSIKVSEPIYAVTESEYPLSLKLAELVLAEKPTDVSDVSDNSLFICKACSAAEEIDYVMNRIHRNVRENGYKYSDFVIISRSQETYNNLIASASEAYGIPCFADKRVSVLSLAFSVFILAGINAAESLDTDEIFRFLKTGFSGLDSDSVATLENYCFIWNINRRKWLDKWTMNPEGLNSHCDDSLLEKLNALRVNAISPLVSLKNRLNGNIGNMCQAVMKLISDCNVSEQLKKYSELLDEKGKYSDAANLRAGYDVFIHNIDKIYAVMGDEVTTAEKFADILKSALKYETVGEIPQMQDEVLYGTADRIRPFYPKVVFVVGANQGVFPAASDESGLFTRKEREMLINNGFNISDNSVSDAIDEKFLFYSACSCATEQLYITYCSADSDGIGIEPSIPVTGIKKRIPQSNFEEYSFERKLDLNDIEALHPAFESLATNFRKSSAERDALEAYFEANIEYCSKLSAINSVSSPDKFRISRETAHNLYGNVLKLSASKIDDFSGCHFKFFCKFGIGALKLNRVDFDARTRGNLIHFVLEHFINNHKKDIGTLDEASISVEVCKLCDEYMESVGNTDEGLDSKFRYMLNLFKTVSTEIIVAVNNEFAQSEFRPKYCELKVGDNAEVKGIGVTTNDGDRVIISGSIDRVDATSDGKVRVIDYKSGGKKFDLSHILMGENLQMLLYLYTVVKNCGEMLKAAKPAGILYFPAKRQYASYGEKTSGYIKMNGLIDSDTDTIRQMENSLAGKIVPAKVKSDGSLYAASSAVSVDDFNTIFKYLDKTLCSIGTQILHGNIDALPIKRSYGAVCDYCDYREICRINNEIFRDEISLTREEALQRIKEEVTENGI